MADFEAVRITGTVLLIHRYALIMRTVPMIHPTPPAVDGHRQVIELHAAVGIEALLIVEHDAEGLHQEAHEPHPQAGPILQENIGQSEDGGDDVEPVCGKKICHI